MWSFPAIASAGQGRGRALLRLCALLAALAVAGCGQGGPSSPPPAESPTPGPVASVAGSPVDSPVPGSPATPPAASESPTSGPTETPGPPVANLVVGGGAPVRGELGSYVWDGAGSDSPWLVPPADEAVRVSGPYRISVTPPLPVERWRSAWARVEDGTVGGPEGPASGGAGPITIREPGLPGTWSLQVDIRFRDGGHAAWYWRVEVLP